MKSPLTWMISFALLAALITFIGAEEQKCDNTVIECIKTINGGQYPVNAWTSLSLLYNRHYSIVWYSEKYVKEGNLKCITTVFGLFGAKDTYYHSCTDKEVIPFKTGFSIIDKTFTIKDYKGMNLKAYAVYFKKYCLGLYVCSPYGVRGPHITIYCPTSQLGNDDVKAEIEEAKAKLTSCNINDGASLCQDKCS